MKKIYEDPQIISSEVSAQDVIATSEEPNKDNETQLNWNK